MTSTNVSEPNNGSEQIVCEEILYYIKRIRIFTIITDNINQDRQIMWGVVEIKIQHQSWNIYDCSKIKIL